MKKIIAIGLIFIMSVQCFFQLGVITYFQLNRDYIAEVLCINREKPITMCYGQCFLKRNLDVADDATTDKGTGPAKSRTADFPIFLITENEYPLQALTFPGTANFRYLIHISPAHHEPPFHPPAFFI